MLRHSMLLSVAVAVVLGAETRLDTKIVSTTGFETSLKNEVRNVIVISKEDIRDKGYRNIKEVLEKSPAISIVDLGFAPVIDMRGQGSKANTNVKTMVNGISTNMLETSHVQPIFDTIPIEDVERVEIIPGGGAVLYGSGTSGGVINIITKTGRRDFYANLGINYGSYSHLSENFGVGGNVNDDLFLKFNAQHFDEKGYRYSEQNKGYYTAGGLVYNIGDWQSVSLDANYFKSKSQDAEALTKQQVDENRRQSKSGRFGSTDLEVKKRTQITLDYALKSGDLVDFHITPYYQKMRFYDVSNSSGGWLDEKDGINVKNRSNYESGNFILGYEFVYNKGDRPSPAAKLRKTTHSIYGLEQHDFTDFFSLSLGLRGQYDIFTIKDSVKNLSSSKGEGNYAFEITPNFKYSDTGNVYFKIERGYTSPGTNQKTDKAPPSIYMLNDIKAETSYTFELGMKDYINNVLFGATAFITNKNNEININWDRFPEFRGLFWHWQNIEKTRRYGAELYSEQYLLDGDLRFNESYSYVKPKITAGNDKGKKIANVPNHKVVLGVNYTIIKPVDVFADLIYYSGKSYYGTPVGTRTEQEYKTKSYEVVNLGASYNFYKGLSVSAGVKNLFDKEYFIDENAARDSYYPAPGRNYYVEFKYKY